MQLTFGQQLAAEMNLTPLIDILLVLLIIFMVVIPHNSLGERAEIPQPSRPESEHKPGDMLVLQLIQSGGGRPTLKINQEPVSWENLEQRLETIFSVRADRTAFLKGDPEVDFEYVAQALDVSRRAGAERVGLISR